MQVLKGDFFLLPLSIKIETQVRYVSQTFHCCDKISKKKNNLRRQDLFWLNVSEDSAWSHCFGVELRQNIMVAGACGRGGGAGGGTGRTGGRGGGARGGGARARYILQRHAPP
jgi:hypothetical protein